MMDRHLPKSAATERRRAPTRGALMDSIIFLALILLGVMVLNVVVVGIGSSGDGKAPGGSGNAHDATRTGHMLLLSTLPAPFYRDTTGAVTYYPDSDVEDLLVEDARIRQTEGYNEGSLQNDLEESIQEQMTTFLGSGRGYILNLTFTDISNGGSAASRTAFISGRGDSAPELSDAWCRLVAAGSLTDNAVFDLGVRTLRGNGGPTVQLEITMVMSIFRLDDYSAARWS